MKLWNRKKRDPIDNARLQAFAEEIMDVSKRHGVSIVLRKK